MKEEKTPQQRENTKFYTDSNIEIVLQGISPDKCKSQGLKLTKD